MQLIIGFFNFIGSFLAFAFQHPIAAIILGSLSFFIISGLIQGFSTVSTKLWIWILNQLGAMSGWIFQLIWNVLQNGFQRLWNRRQKA